MPDNRGTFESSFMVSSPLQSRHSAPSDRILFFTLHRSGSTYAHNACLAMCKACGIPYASPNPGGDEQFNVRSLAERPELFRAKTGCIGPLRFYIPMADPDHDKIILQLRDPRDVLTSMFYSYCFSHTGPVPGGTGYRQEVADRGIDAFVIAMATATTPPLVGDYGTGNHLWDLTGNVAARYQRYIDHLLCLPNVTLLRYEQLALDLPAWMQTLAGVFDPDRAEALAAEVLPKTQGHAEPAVEDIWSHKRKVIPGDHRDKLSAETITRLNEVFSVSLHRLGYV